MSDGRETTFVNRKIGITTTIPVEAVFAAGDTPIDLNNVFVTAADARSLVERAEIAGYPANICAWIKGIYTVAIEVRPVDAVIAVTQGDCSNTHALMETLELRGIPVIPFGFPYDADRDLLRLQIEKLVEALGTSWERTVQVKRELDPVRKKLRQLDELTWSSNQITGSENLLFLVNSSDFEGDWKTYEQKVDRFLAEVSEGKPIEEGVRIGFVGVPPIFSDLHAVVESFGARIVFNEIPRQFSMPYRIDDLVEQYVAYTYPYGIFRRIEDITEAVEERNIHALIHYAQSFCFRQIEDLILREKIRVPILMVEGDKPGPVDARTKVRIQAFVEMLEGR
jgi:benzoyl-CoA reductase/2-hydroxyglutaryl-CoA dehydratase subunit BcrC/BadD/HgdB